LQVDTGIVLNPHTFSGIFPICSNMINKNNKAETRWTSKGFRLSYIQSWMTVSDTVLNLQKNQHFSGA